MNEMYRSGCGHIECAGLTTCISPGRAQWEIAKSGVEFLYAQRQADALERIATALERLADEAAHVDAVTSRAAALDEWRHGQGKHPDD